jgi:hypothetical protein
MSALLPAPGPGLPADMAHGEAVGGAAEVGRPAGTARGPVGGRGAAFVGRRRGVGATVVWQGPGRAGDGGVAA